MSFEEWLDNLPYKNLLSEGTIKLMHGAWVASRLNLDPMPGVQFYEPDGSRMRGDIHE